MKLLIMKQQLIFLFIISSFFVSQISAQEKKDSIVVKQQYGLRIGADISKPAIAFFDNNFTGIELVADARVYKNYFAAVELGYENKTTNEEYLNFTSNGSYIKVGFNYNAYKNWAGMQNEIYVGFRYGLGFFTQTLNSYTPNIKGTFFIPETNEINSEYSNLSAQWAALVFGLKVETFNNVYLGASVSFKRIMNTKEPENFKNLYIPGFNRVYLNNMGFGFNYTISYLIPLIKKVK